ncbi:hypothetical protein FRC15_004371 [Serendipita sp. 397]|nr:hypothetical protein FRC15_004371 [Serendipita sp. 397]
MQHNASKNNGRRRRESRSQPSDDDPSRHSFAFIGVTDEGGRGDSELSSSAPQAFVAGTRRDIASLPSTTTTTTTGREAPSSGPFMTTETSTTSTSTSSLHPLHNPHQYFMVHGRGGGQPGLPSPLAFHHQHHPQPPPSAISVPFSTSSSSHTSLERHQQHPRQNLSSTATSIAHFPSSSAVPASSSSSSTQHQPYTEQQEHASTRPGGRSIGRTRRPASHSADLATAATGGTNRTIDESFSTTTTLTSSVPIGARIGERIPEAYGTMSTAASAVPIEDNIYTSIEQHRPLGARHEQALSRSTEEEETRQGEEGQTTITTTAPITTTANNRIESMQTSHMPSSSSKDYYAHAHHVLPSMPLPPTTSSSYKGNPALQLPQPPNYPPPSTSISLLDRGQRQHEWSAVRDQREEVHESFSYIPPATTTGSAYSPRPDTAATSSFGYLSGAGGVPTGDEDDGEDQEEEAEEQGEREGGEQEGDVRSPPELPQPHDVEEPNTQDDEDNTRQQQQEEEEDNFVDETEEFDDATTTRSKDKKRKKQDPRPHKCDECGKAFPRPSALETHKTVHSGAKPYNCPVVTCNKSFAVRSNARRHLKTHGIKLKTRDRKSRSKAASLNKALALGGLSGRMSGGEGNRDTSPDNDMGSEGEGEDSFGASGESMPFPPDSYSAPSRAATTMTTTTVIRDAGRIPYPTGERMLSRVPGAGLRPAMHRGHVNTRVDEDEVLGLGGIEPLSSEIEILQRPEEEEDGETSEEEVEGEGGAKVKRQSLRIGAGRKVIIETAGAITSKKRQGEITSASGSSRGGKEKGKGKVVADSAEKLRGKRRGVAEARRQRGVESRRSEERRDEHVEGRVNPPFMGTDGGEHGEEGGEGPVLDQEELRNLWASTQRRHLASSSASVGGGGEGDPSSMLGADGRQHATIGSLPKLDQEALEKLIAAPTAWENYQRQLKMKQTLAASTSASGGGGGGGTGGENARNEGAGGGGSGAGEATDPNTFGELVGADGPSNHLDQMIAMAHSQIPLHSGSSVVSSFGPLPHASSSVRTSVIAPPPMLASTIYFDQQRPAAVAVNGTTAFNPQSPEADIIDRRPWINPTSSSSSVSSLSPIEGGVGSGALNAISAAADTNDTTLDVTCPPINEEEDIPSGFNKFDGTWIPDSMRRFKNVDRLRNSAPFDDLGLSTLQMQFPLTGEWFF